MNESRSWILFPASEDILGDLTFWHTCFRIKIEYPIPSQIKNRKTEGILQHKHAASVSVKLFLLKVKRGCIVEKSSETTEP